MPPKNREVEKLLKAHGFVFKEQRGSHRHFEHPKTGIKITIVGEPADEMPRGTSYSVLKAAGIQKKRGW